VLIGFVCTAVGCLDMCAVSTTLNLELCTATLTVIPWNETPKP